jgi:DNA (cytosine-5)-methyltransferase 1
MAGKGAKRLHNDPLFQGQLPQAVTVMDAIGDLPAVESGGRALSYDDKQEPTNYGKMIRGDCNNLTLHESTRHSDKMMEIIRLAGTSRAALPEGLTSSGFSSCYSRLEADRPSVTLTVNFVHPASNRCIHPFQNRALTPREGARIQGFPDAYQFFGTRAQIVKQIGNAVPPILGKAIATSLVRAMGLKADERGFRRSSMCEDQQANGLESSRQAAIG